MIVYYICMEAQFNNEEENIAEIEQKHTIKITDVTKFQVKLCEKKHEIYHGPKVYMFMGDWPNLVNYFVNDYPLQDIDELEDLVKDIQTLEI